MSESRADFSALPLIDLFHSPIESSRLQVQPLHRLDCCYFSSAPLTDNIFKLRAVYRFSPFVDAVLLCDCYTFTLPLQYVFPFELCHCAEDCKHKLAGRVVVSIASFFDTNSTFFFVSCSTKSNRSRVFLANLEIDSTITVSPSRTNDIIFLSCGRSMFCPLILSM